jgi:hypothetical protein
MYSDAEEDFTQVSMLAVVWGGLFFGAFSASITPILLTYLSTVAGRESPAGLPYEPLLFPLALIPSLPVMSTAFRGFKRVQEVRGRGGVGGEPLRCLAPSPHFRPPFALSATRIFLFLSSFFLSF